MTLHHLQHRSESGSTSAENGAIINELAHRYMHSLPRNQEEIINNYIREWKKQHYDKCQVQIDEFPEPDFEINISEIEIDDNIKIKPLTRAQIKVQTRKAYEEYLNERED